MTILSRKTRRIAIPTSSKITTAATPLKEDSPDQEPQGGVAKKGPDIIQETTKKVEEFLASAREHADATLQVIAELEKMKSGVEKMWRLEEGLENACDKLRLFFGQVDAIMRKKEEEPGVSTRWKGRGVVQTGGTEQGRAKVMSQEKIDRKIQEKVQENVTTEQMLEKAKQMKERRERREAMEKNADRLLQDAEEQQEEEECSTTLPCSTEKGKEVEQGKVVEQGKEVEQGNKEAEQQVLSRRFYTLLNSRTLWRYQARHSMIWNMLSYLADVLTFGQHLQVIEWMPHHRTHIRLTQVARRTRSSHFEKAKQMARERRERREAALHGGSKVVQNEEAVNNQVNGLPLAADIPGSLPGNIASGRAESVAMVPAKGNVAGPEDGDGGNNGRQAASASTRLGLVNMPGARPPRQHSPTVQGEEAPCRDKNPFQAATTRGRRLRTPSRHDSGTQSPSRTASRSPSRGPVFREKRNFFVGRKSFPK